MGKIPVVKVSLLWSENDSMPLPRHFPTIDEADAYLRRMAHDAPKDGSYHKTDFQIVFADGEDYKGRYDLTHPDAREGPVSIARHVLRFALHYSGRMKDSDLPSHLPPEIYRANIAKHPHREEYAKFLDNYEIDAQLEKVML